ncbi:MAG: hypothetical protein SFX72_05430 [Isosphaeraceae bacterium]|nr:hypothetical protein [Isosphaeraceae bacterium]
MLTPMRSLRWFAATTLVALLGLSFVSGQARAADPKASLSDKTIFLVEVKSVVGLREAFSQTAFGQMIADPAMKAMKDSVSEKLAELDKKVKEEVGYTIAELVDVPQGPVTLAVQAAEGKFPVAILATADAGKNADKMAALMKKLNAAAEKSGKAKVSTKSFKSLTLNIIKGEKEDEPSLIWTNNGSVYHISIATDSAALEDCISHADGRDDSLVKSENYARLGKKLGETGQVSWFLDVSKLIKAGVNAAQAAGGNQNPEAILQLLGINGLKAVGGTLMLNAGKYDAMSKTVILAPAPAQGILKMFSMPKKDLRPETWVPATVSTYQTMSWDLDAAFTAMNDLLNMFQPGMINAFEQQLVGPAGGEPLSFQKDIFGPLGNRITMISDFKKPIKEDSQRILFAIALDDAKKFTNTVNKIIALANGSPKKREFQGATIYDFELPEIPNNAPNNPFQGTVSLTVAKDYLMVATEPGLLEAVLRGGAATLAENAAFQAAVKDVPTQTSSLSFAGSEEQARASYDMIKSGQFEKALEQAGAAGPDLSFLGKLFDKDKLPEFSVFAKYLSNAAGYAEMDDDGVTFTSFSVRKANP